MDIITARQILKAHRPNRPARTEGKQLQTAIDTVLAYEDQLDRWRSATAGAQVGVPLNGDDIVFYSGILRIIKVGGTKATTAILSGDYNKGISLSDIRKKNGEIVIYENENNGIIYRYHVYGDYWEKIGHTIGYT